MGWVVKLRTPVTLGRGQWHILDGGIRSEMQHIVDCKHRMWPFAVLWQGLIRWRRRLRSSIVVHPATECDARQVILDLVGHGLTVTIRSVYKRRILASANSTSVSGNGQQIERRERLLRSDSESQFLGWLAYGEFGASRILSVAECNISNRDGQWLRGAFCCYRGGEEKHQHYDYGLDTLIGKGGHFGVKEGK